MFIYNYLRIIFISKNIDLLFVGGIGNFNIDQIEMVNEC